MFIHLTLENIYLVATEMAPQLRVLAGFLEVPRSGRSIHI